MMRSAAEKELACTVSGLSDDQLLEQTTRLALLDHQIQVFVIDHLLEIEARGLYLSRGFPSLFAYVARGLGYSDASAWRRINAMKLCARIEGARERLRDGSLTLDAAAQLQAAFERRDRERAHLTRGVGSGMGSATKPNGAAPPAPVLDVSARKALVERAVGKSTRQVMQMLAAVDPALAVPADRVRPLSEGRWELKAVIDAECQRGLEQLRGLLSHVDPHMTLGQLVGRLVQEGLDRHDPGRPRRGRRAERTSAARNEATADGDASPAVERTAMHADAVAAPASAQAAPIQGAASAKLRPAQPAQDRAIPALAPADQPLTLSATQPAPTPASAPKRHARTASAGTLPSKTPRDPDRGATSAPKRCARAGRAIPAAVRRQVWQRDEGGCSYVDPVSGRRCGSSHLLQVDHVFPYALGGGSDPPNLRLLCFAHHRERHAARAHLANVPGAGGQPPPKDGDSSTANPKVRMTR